MNTTIKVILIIIGSLAVAADRVKPVRTRTRLLELRTGIFPGEFDIIPVEHIINRYPNGSLLKIECLKCGLKQLLDSNFIGAPKLTELLLKSNKIKKVEGNMFKGIENLEKLDLSNNQIEVLTSDLLRHLPNLKVFFALHNKIHHIDSNTFNKMHHIDISYNPIVELNLKFENIYTLELMDCKLNKVTLDGDIYELFMGQNEINELNLLKNSNLNGIDLGGNNLTTSVIKSVNGENLKTLLLNGTKLDYDYLGDNIFQSMPNLTMLNLSNTNLSSLNQKLLEPLQNLVYLAIHENNIREVDSKVFEQLPKLKIVHWENNPWKCSSLLPVLKYHHSELNQEQILNLMSNSTICSDN